ncbi:MAG: ABC-type polysaccharide/polyol phosphate export permease [Bacteriovoracaceae bacterium]|jgi:lipopolysaccharide transport system permease protein
MRIKEQFTVISTLTLAEMKGRYRNTVAGVLWVMFNPLIMFGVHALIFKHILKINVDRYYIFLLSGLLPWIYINNTLTQTVHSFLTMRESLLSFQIHPVSVIVSKSIDNFTNFIFPFIFLFILLYDSENFSWHGILLLPFAMIILFLGVTYMALFLATLQVFFRDTQYITNFVLSVMFFLTPIFYPRHLIPDEYQIFVDANPFYAFINIFKVNLWDFSYAGAQDAFLYSLGFLGIIMFITTIFWTKTRNELYINI